MNWQTTLTPEIIARYTAQGWWRNETLDRRLAAAAARTPDKPAVIDRFGQISYAELAGQVERVAGALHRLGVRPGDTVTLQLPNWREFVVMHLALTRLGAITNPVLTLYRQRELLTMTTLAESVLAVTCTTYRKHDHAAMWAEVLPQVPSLRGVIVVDPTGEWSGGNGLIAYRDLLAQTGGDPPPGPTDGNAVTVLLYTSGTVANKGVMHTHNTMFYGTAGYQQALGLTPDDVVWMPSPISHGTGLEWGVRTAVYLGSTLVLQDIWDPEEACRLIEKHRCTVTMGATPFAHDLVQAAVKSKYDLSSFKYFSCAGSPIPRELARLSREQIGCELLGAYGMSEHFVSTISRPTDPEHLRGGTDGRPLEGTEVAVWDDDRKRMLPPGEMGELAIRGPGVAVGYLKDPERTAATFRADGWQFSEDLAVIDEQGFVRIVGRKKDMIIRGGLNISPTEVEDLAFTHPAIQRVAVVGYPDRRLGERACAFVVPKAGQTLTLQDLTGFLLGKGLAKFKLPERLELVDDLPTTPSGKVQKFKLRERLTAEQQG